MKDKLLLMCKELNSQGAIIPPEFTGLVILIPKRTSFKTLENLRPITLLNGDYKIFAGTLTRRMRNVMNIRHWNTPDERW